MVCVSNRIQSNSITLNYFGARSTNLTHLQSFITVWMRLFCGRMGRLGEGEGLREGGEG